MIRRSHDEVVTLLAESGPEALTDPELLSVALQVRLPIAEQMVAQQTVDELLDNPQRLTDYIPVARHREQFVATAELVQRSRAVPTYTTPRIQTCADALPHFHAIAYKDKEHLMVLVLDIKNRVVHTEVVAVGTLHSCFMSPREIFKVAIQHSAASLIVGHNHPSGDLSPSEQDIQATQQIADAGRILNIPLVDHLIVTGHRDQYLSLRSEGVL